jgi:purine-nucleoside phosphorylase
MATDQIIQACDFLEKIGIIQPEIGIVLGTGLGKMVKKISIEKEVSYDDIPGFVKSTVESHHGRLIYGSLHGKKLLAMHGRFHYYEGYSMQQITFPVRVMKMLGVKFLLLSNAAGALNLNFKKGSLMLINDHINLLPDNPLRGSNIDELGPRFPDMSCPYSDQLNLFLKQSSKEEGIQLNEGVYAAVQGPNLETRAEYRYLKNIGADAVGMSTVPEVIVANHMNIPCAAVSVLTDECDPDNLKPVELAEILRIAGLAEDQLIRLFSRLISMIE